MSIALCEELSLLDNGADNYIFKNQNRMIEQTFDTDGVACRVFCASDDKIDTLLTVCCAFIHLPTTHSVFRGSNFCSGA